jgi:hypothetical protein
MDLRNLNRCLANHRRLHSMHLVSGVVLGLETEIARSRLEVKVEDRINSNDGGIFFVHTFGGLRILEVVQ